MLIWLQRQFWLLVTQPDPWRLSYEMPSARPSKVATEKTAARNATKTLPAVSSESKAKEAAAKGCRNIDDPLSIIPRRQLFDLIEPCIVVRGRIDSEPIPDPDGLVFDFVPDPSQAQLFEDANKAVGIIAPPDMPGCTPSELGEFHLGVSAATCSGANVTVPPPGTEVEIVGAYVFDRELEAPVIAPVWAVKPASRAPG